MPEKNPPFIETQIGKQGQIGPLKIDYHGLLFECPSCGEDLELRSPWCARCDSKYNVTVTIEYA